VLTRRRSQSWSDLELRGVTAHAWGLSTVQRVLSSSCCVRSLHADTAAQSDLAVFGVQAWCRRLDSIPPAVSMFIPDPVLPGAEQQVEKRGLLYPVSVTAARAPSGAAHPPPPAPESDLGRRRRRRPRHRALPLRSLGGPRCMPGCAPRRWFEPAGRQRAAVYLCHDRRQEDSFVSSPGSGSARSGANGCQDLSILKTGTKSTIQSTKPDGEKENEGP
jgi:hypothetical protein